MDQARLIPADDGEPVELTRDVTLVGRKEDCDLQIDHKSISKQHCVLVKTDGLVFIRDLGSTNGTRVNGQRVRRAALVPNDEVAFAGRKYRLTVGQAPPEPNAETQAMKADELAEYVKAAEPPEPDTPEPIPPKVEIHTHDLPDVYPDEPSKA
jgi:pSer/pThr/pTyr-binding forkhead associated (FHA) protein